MPVATNFKEYLTEMSTVFRDNKANISVGVNGNIGRIGDAYFKLYNSGHFESATKVAIIKFSEPKYVIHCNFKDLENWTLNSKERKQLIAHLKTEARLEGKLFTHFQRAIILFNFERGLGNSVEDCIEKMLNKDYDDTYLSLDLEMPDYSNLS